MEPTDLGESDHALLFPFEKWLVELRTVPGLLHAQVLAPCLAWMATGRGGGCPGVSLQLAALCVVGPAIWDGAGVSLQKLDFKERKKLTIFSLLCFKALLWDFWGHANGSLFTGGGSGRAEPSPGQHDLTSPSQSQSFRTDQDGSSKWFLCPVCLIAHSLG